MSDVVICAENLGKKYVIGHQAENGRYSTFRDIVVQNVRGVWDKTRDLIQGKPIIQGDIQEEVWALKDVNFEIHQGEAVGIIGRNGAGKSTLLKILSRITEPSTGRVTIKGRVASLLEVGTGFHPELSGRENIYLNGAILGMTRSEINCKFDEIVDFSGVEKYIDTPVKRYSSGMHVRLAFAVAAHLEPEILVVDEVLAVGDAEFQKKSLGKMGDVASEGRTVLFVSHNIGSIRQLCSRGIWLDVGQIYRDGPINDVVDAYYTRVQSNGTSGADISKFPRDVGLGISLRILCIHLRNASGEICNSLRYGEKFTIEFEASTNKTYRGLSATFGIESIYNNRILTSASEDSMGNFDVEVGQKLQLVIDVNNIPLNVGRYTITVGLRSGRQVIDHVKECFTFDILDTPYPGMQMVAPRLHGALRYPANWHIDSI